MRCWTAALMLLCAARAWAGAWDVYPLTTAAPVRVDLSYAGLSVGEVSFRQTDDEGWLATLTARAAPGTAGSERLVLALFDAQRQPLVCLGEQCQWRPGRGLFVSTEPAWNLVFRCGAQPRAAWFALGCVQPPQRRGNLLLEAAGARVREVSSTFGANYAPESTLHDEPPGCWSSDTGRVNGEWLLYELPGAAPQRIAAVGLNPAAEPNFPSSALREFSVWVSTTGTAPADFKEVCRSACEPRGELQRFAFPPVDAHFVKLVCLSNQGHPNWVELTRFEVYPPALVATDPLVALVTEFPYPGPLATTSLECRRAAGEIPDGGGLARLTYEFGNLLGGAPQWAALVLDRTLPANSVRLQFALRCDRPGNSLRLVLADAEGARWTVDLGRLDHRGWRLYGVDLQPKLGAKTPRYPLKLAELVVVPKLRDALRGQLELADLVTLTSAPR